MTPQQLRDLHTAGLRLMQSGDNSIRTVGRSMVAAHNEIVRLNGLLEAALAKVPAKPKPPGENPPGAFCECWYGCENGCSQKPADVSPDWR